MKDKILGTVTAASVSGNALLVSGLLYTKNQPQLIQNLLATERELGLSFEISDVSTESDSASIWVLTGLEWTGVAVLPRREAAYQSSSFRIGR
jgi:hypothetical protein